MRGRNRGVPPFWTGGIAFVLLVGPLVSPASASTFAPKYREILAQFDIGVVHPSSDPKHAMDTGTGFGAQLGIALTPRITSGFFLDYQVLGSTQSIVPPGRNVGDNNWTRYSGGAFGEFLLTETRLTPFIGGYVGVQGIHISYANLYDTFEGQGDYGLGFGVASGLRYRMAQRVGTTLRVQADNSPKTNLGWFFEGRLGLTLFL